jgi:type IV pilus assembly protein PilA
MAQLSERLRASRSSFIDLLLIAIAIIFAILTIALTRLGGDRMNANEMAVVRELQFINTVQIQYKSEFQRYATTLAELGPHSADLIPATLASGDKDGYVFILAPTPGDYTIHANPKMFGRSGYRTFYSDQNGLIRQNWSAEPANASSPEFK